MGIVNRWRTTCPATTESRQRYPDEEAVKALGALAQETRLWAFRLLSEAGPQGRPAGVLADALGVPANTLSFHLRQLLKARLVTKRRIGRQLDRKSTRLNSSHVEISY